MIRSFICSELANKTILKTMIQLTELSIKDNLIKSVIHKQLG